MVKLVGSTASLDLLVRLRIKTIDRLANSAESEDDLLTNELMSL